MLGTKSEKRIVLRMLSVLKEEYIIAGWKKSACIKYPALKPLSVADSLANERKSARMLTVSSSRAAAAAAALRPSGLLWRQMSMFESKWKKKKDKKMVIKYYKRTKPLPTDHDKDMPSESFSIPLSTVGFFNFCLVAVFDYSSKNPMSRVYMWGMACYGALGVPEYLRPKRRHVEPLKTMHRLVLQHLVAKKETPSELLVNRPARCSFVETRGVSDVACGYGFTVFAVSPGNSKGSHIMGTGINKSGQLGEKKRTFSYF